MNRLRKLTFAIGALLLTALTASAAIPGAQRALCPTCFGMVEVDDNIFIDTDNTQIAARLLDQLGWSVDQVEAYMGSYKARPRILLCTDENGACTKLFGNLGPRGMAWGADLVRLNARGLNPTIMVHELFHTELHHRMGIWGMLNDSIPMWFNEGLAIHLSKDERFPETYTQEDRDWALRYQTAADWKAEVNENNWRRAYGASASRVEELEKRIGPSGIMNIIDDVTLRGIPFDEALAAIDN